MMAQSTKTKIFVFQKQILDIDQDKEIKRECSNKYKWAPPRLVHYLGFCIWIQNAQGSSLYIYKLEH